MQGSAFDRFMAEHRAITAQVSWVCEWVGLQFEAKHARDAVRYHVSNQCQLKNMIVDLKDGLKYHYALEEGMLRSVMPQRAGTIGKDHESVLHLMDDVQGLLETHSPESAELGQAAVLMFWAIESHNAEEEMAYSLFGEVHAGQSVPLPASLPSLSSL